MLVLKEKEKDSPVGYVCIEILGYSAFINLFEVRADLRGSGIGKIFFKKILLFCASRGINAFKLKTEDERAKEFWEKLRFRFYKNYRDFYIGSLILKSPPQKTQKKSIKVGFYYRGSGADGIPVSSGRQNVTATLTKSFKVQLERPVVFFFPEDTKVKSYQLTISINSKPVFCGPPTQLALMVCENDFFWMDHFNIGQGGYLELNLNPS